MSILNEEPRDDSIFEAILTQSSGARNRGQTTVCSPGKAQRNPGFQLTQISFHPGLFMNL